MTQQILQHYHNSSPMETTSVSSLPRPVLKRRRVTRACDECRRKKIKCDGKLPCTHCTVYSYGKGVAQFSSLYAEAANMHLADCSYDQPSNRKRNPGPQYIEGLEKDKHQLGTLIQLLRPDLNPFDPSFNVGKVISQLQDSAPPNGSNDGSPRDDDSFTSDDNSPLESMVEATGRLEIDEDGVYDFHGHSSNAAFMLHIRKNFTKVLGQDVPTNIKNMPFPKPMESPQITEMAETSLPSREVAQVLVDSCLEDACVLMKFVHRPSFDKMLNRIYSTPRCQWNREDRSFLPLLYSAFAVGCLFSTSVGGLPFDQATSKGYVCI